MNEADKSSESQPVGQYHPDLIKAAKLLTATDDPLAESRYFSGLHQSGLTNEPGETVFIARQCAYEALELHEAGQRLTGEDVVFLKVEERIQSQATSRHLSHRREGVFWTLLGISCAQGIAILILTGAPETARQLLSVPLGIGGLAGIVGMFGAVRSHIRLKKSEGLAGRFRDAITKTPSQRSAGL